MLAGAPRVDRAVRRCLFCGRGPPTAVLALSVWMDWIASLCGAGVAVRARRKVVSESDFLSAIQKVIKDHAKFSATSTYMQHN